MNDIDRTSPYADDPEQIRAACADVQHPYHQDGADGQGGIAGRCFCGEVCDYPVGGAA